MKRFIGLLVCTLVLVTPVSASASHNYHANMISKNFSSSDDGGHKANQKADKWVDNISDLSDYHVSSTQAVSGRNQGVEMTFYTDRVVLTKKHESHYQKKNNSLLGKIVKALYDLHK